MQLKDAIKQFLCGWQAARHIDVYRNQAVAEMVVSAPIGTAAHAYHSLRLGHEVVELLKHWSRRCQTIFGVERRRDVQYIISILVALR